MHCYPCYLYRLNLFLLPHTLTSLCLYLFLCTLYKSISLSIALSLFLFVPIFPSLSVCPLVCLSLFLSLIISLFLLFSSLISLPPPPPPPKKKPVCDSPTECSWHWYGSGCSQRCSFNCGRSGDCDPVNGICVYGCVKGYKGGRCNIRIRSGQ